jgi:hypothetical protein
MMDYKILEEQDNLFFRLHKIRLSPEQIEALKEEKKIIIQDNFYVFRFSNSFYVFPAQNFSLNDFDILFEKGFVAKTNKDQIVFLQLHPPDDPEEIRQVQGTVRCNDPDVEMDDHVMRTLIKTGKKDIVPVKYKGSIVKAIVQWDGKEFNIEF